MTEKNRKTGRYIVLEGPEGVGKSTQLELLSKRFRDIHIPVRMFREPDSQSDLTARAIRRLMLDPSYPMNTRTEVLLYNAARSQLLDIIRVAKESGITSLVDRNFLTTLANQYYGRGDVPDYQMINNIIDFAVGDMLPDLTIVMDAPVSVLQTRKVRGKRFDNQDLEFMERVRAGYLWEAKQRGYPVVHAVNPPEHISDAIWQIVQEHEKTGSNKSAQPINQSEPPINHEPAAIKEVLAARQASLVETVSIPKLDEKLTASNVNNDEPFLTKQENGQYSITPRGKKFLAEAVTNDNEDVYAFSEKLSPVTIAAAMARLSRRGDDMRITLLDEFAESNSRDEGLLKRVITAYGDDSVQQLAGLHVVVENASQLLTKKLEWGRLAAYLEQSTRYIFFDQKDKDGKYRYYTPQYLEPKLKNSYIKQMDQIFELYSELVRKLTDYVQARSEVSEADRDGPWRAATRAQACDAARPTLPVATKTTVGIFASGQALESLIMHLMSDELEEAKQTGKSLLAETRKVMPVFFERADNPERGGATMAYYANTRSSVKNLTHKQLPQQLSVETEPVQLTSFWPHNELDIVADILYEHSNSPLTEIQKEVSKWSYTQKEEAFKSYIGERFNRRHRPGRALEKVHYSWDLVCDYGIFRDLQRHRMVDDLNWQLLTPRYGYDIPELVEKAGLSDLFEQCFDISLKLYSEMQAADYELEAQYATLLGHKMRWKVTYNARQAFHMLEIRTTPQGHPGYRKLSQQMHEKLSEVHPLIGAAMRFVNQDEDPKLTRLAAERYTQFKLNQLEKNPN